MNLNTRLEKLERPRRSKLDGVTDEELRALVEGQIGLLPLADQQALAVLDPRSDAFIERLNAMFAREMESL